MTDPELAAAGVVPESCDVVRERLEALRRRISDAGGNDIEVLAVTKTFGVAEVLAARDAGLVDVGENYADELITKATHPDMDPTMRWHFIGRLQSNKIKTLAPHVAVWQSIDRAKLGQRIARFAPGATVYVQLRPSGLDEASAKGGCRIDDAPDLVRELRDLGLHVGGVMSVGVAGDDLATATAFADAVRFADDLELPVRSLGMSADLELAVAAGTTMVRVGSALFGPRDYGAAS